MSRSNAKDNYLMVVCTIAGVILYGPTLALLFRQKVTLMGTELAPLLAPTFGIILAVLVVRMFWNRY